MDLNQENELDEQLVHFVLSIIPEKHCSKRHEQLQQMLCSAILYETLTNPSLHIVKQIWKDISYEIAVNSPGSTWWTNTGSQESCLLQ
jgi:hypothetical protein